MAPLDSHPPQTAIINKSTAIQFKSLCFWLAVQLLVLCVGAARTPLTARAGDERQHLALPEMIVTQMAIAAMTFPWLLSRGNRIAMTASAIVFLHLAAMLTGTGAAAEVWTAIGVGLWLAALACLSEVLTSDAAKSIGIVCTTAISCGIPIIHYLIDDFGDTATASHQLPLWLNPVTACVKQSTDARFAISSIAVSSLSIVSIMIFRFASSRHADS